MTLELAFGCIVAFAVLSVLFKILAEWAHEVLCESLIRSLSVKPQSKPMEIKMQNPVNDAPYGLKKDGTPKAKPGRKVGFKAKKPEPVTNPPEVANPVET